MKDKVVLITGGSSGIGEALAYEFGVKGSRIAITGRNQEALDNTVAGLSGKGIECLAIQADASIEEDNRVTVDQVIKKYGKLDIVVANAGISMRALIEDVDLEVVKKVMDINFNGALYIIKYALPHIMETKGSVIGISSIAGFRGLPARVGYSASKFALNGLLEVLRTEMLHRGVHVLTACPGFTATNIRERNLDAHGTPQGKTPRDESKSMSAEECARHIYKATIRRRRMLVLTFEGKAIRLINKFFPSLADRLTYNFLAREADSPFK
jgi:dehydrogenase/reductase SDR family protein 7B